MLKKWIQKVPVMYRALVLWGLVALVAFILGIVLA
jgi:hypothetical protein